MNWKFINSSMLQKLQNVYTFNYIENVHELVVHLFNLHGSVCKQQQQDDDDDDDDDEDDDYMLGTSTSKV